MVPYGIDLITTLLTVARGEVSSWVELATWSVRRDIGIVEEKRSFKGDTIAGVHWESVKRECLPAAAGATLPKPADCLKGSR